MSPVVTLIFAFYFWDIWLRLLSGEWDRA